MARAPSTSSSITAEDADESLTKDIINEGIYACIQILKGRGIISGKAMKSCSEQARLLAQDMANAILAVIQDYELAVEDELFASNEISEESLEDSLDESLHIESPERSVESALSELSQPVSQPFSSDYEPEEKKRKFDAISIEKKIQVVNLSREHPKWSLATLRARGAACLTRKDELIRWKREIQNGGTLFDKTTAIKKWTYDRFCEARENQVPVTTRNIQEWALQASMQYASKDFHFSASIAWANRFKQEHRIKQRKVTRYVKSTEKRSLEAILTAAEDFQKICVEEFATFDSDYVLNTDQMGCEYRANVQRTMEHVGKKMIEVHLGDMNKVTHTYTAQYTITASGKLLNRVLICLQEPKGTFGPKVGERVEALVAEYKNIYVVSSKSGKLTSALFDLYTTNVLQPYVENKQFALLIDSWGGHSNKRLFQKFKDESGKSTCSLQVIPPGCTPYCQPLDVYFHKQVKIFIKELQNCTHLLQERRQINTREDTLKIQALVTNKLCAPIFREMIRYAWFASKLTQDRDVFMNVREVCFPERPIKTRCKCAENRGDTGTRSIGFIKCSWCRQYLCFICFYELYHPTHCNKFFTNIG